MLRSIMPISGRHRPGAAGAAAMRRVKACLTAASTLVAAGAFAAIAAFALAGGPSSAQGAPQGDGPQWVVGWSASPVTATDIHTDTCPGTKGLANRTVRNVVFLSAGGDTVRVRLANTFGTRAVRVGRATVAVQSGSGAGVVPGTLRTLAFGGQPGTSIAAGGQILSDPAQLPVAALTTLLVSIYLPEPTGPLTNHPGTVQRNFISTGDLSTATTGVGYGYLSCWMLLDAVEVQAPHRYAGTVVTLGDSITDTAVTTRNANRRWPDYLARRLNAKPGLTLSVSNEGIGGNRLLPSRGAAPYFGVPVPTRLDRDVFAAAGVRDVILLIGVNDIGSGATAAQLIAGLRRVVGQTHAHGLRIFGGTITGFAGSHLDTPARRAVRNAVNTWIAGPESHFDGVIDFARALADPGNPAALRRAYDSGDHLHPNDAGCRAMAGAVDLTALLD
ncbi:MAG: SGNH/GDSL hydrolase family protein [Micromonosporaceae bacterium]|nr:SGNH/GDSL hydrolase family protein [Micromonosporaceae bacterium]